MSTQTVSNGTPCWYELATGDLAGAGDFYSEALGWDVAGESAMEGFDYRLGGPSGAMVAGLMDNAMMGGAPPAWRMYFTATGVDAAVQAVTAAGGSVLQPAADIPGTGRFAVVADPQGAVFGLLQPDTSQPTPAVGAFDQSRAGHGNWHELMTTDPEAAFAFYHGLFGWETSAEVEMPGDMGTYRIFSHRGTDIGGMMGLGNAPMPTWLPYFGVDGVTEAITRIEGGGGTTHHGPHAVPGGAHVAICTDPQGAWFAIVGPLNRS